MSNSYVIEALNRNTKAVQESNKANQESNNIAVAQLKATQESNELLAKIAVGITNLVQLTELSENTGKKAEASVHTILEMLNNGTGQIRMKVGQ